MVFLLTGLGIVSSWMLLLSAASHARRIADLQSILDAHRVVPRLSIVPLSLVLTVLEATVGGAGIAGVAWSVAALVEVAAVGAAFMGIAFVIYIGVASGRSSDAASISCGCGFGGSLGVESVVRASALAAMAGLGIVGASMMGSTWPFSRGVALAVAALPLAGLIHIVPTAAEGYARTHIQLAVAYGLRRQT